MGLFDKFKSQKTIVDVPKYESYEALSDDLSVLNRMYEHYNGLKPKNIEIVYNIARKIVILDNEHKYLDPIRAIANYAADDEIRNTYLEMWYYFMFMRTTDLNRLGDLLVQYIHSNVFDSIQLYKIAVEKAYASMDKNEQSGSIFFRTCAYIFAYSGAIIWSNYHNIDDFMKYLNNPFSKYYFARSLTYDNRTKKKGVQRLYQLAKEKEPFALAYIINMYKNDMEFIEADEPKLLYWNTLYEGVNKKALQVLKEFDEAEVNKWNDLRNEFFEGIQDRAKCGYFDIIHNREEFLNELNDDEVKLIQHLKGILEADSMTEELVSELHLNFNLMLHQRYKSGGSSAMFLYALGKHINLPTGIGYEDELLECLLESVRMKFYDAYLEIIDYYGNKKDDENMNRYILYASFKGVIEAMVSLAITKLYSNDELDQMTGKFWLNILASLSNKTLDEALSFIEEYDGENPFEDIIEYFSCN